MRNLVFTLGVLYLMTAAGSGIFKVMFWPFSNELLLAAMPLGVAFWIVLLSFLLFRVGRRVS